MEELRSELMALIERIEERAYRRGRTDAKDDLVRTLVASITDADDRMEAATAATVPAPKVAEQTNSVDESMERVRAPKGVGRALILRAMSTGDIEPKDALDAAETVEERMVSISTIRAELRRGKDEGRYDIRNGRWFLATNEEAEAAGVAVTGMPPAALGTSDGGKHNAAALAD